MDVREATEADADRLAAFTDAPVEVMRNLVHDRTVRVAVEGHEPVGFVSFDAEASTVHITQIEGTDDSRERLLEEPVRFATNEGMSVELLVPETDARTRQLAEACAFEAGGSGPRFDGTPTVRYRLEP